MEELKKALAEIWYLLVWAFTIGGSWAAVKWQLKGSADDRARLHKEVEDMKGDFAKKYLKTAEDIEEAERIINTFLIKGCTDIRKSCMAGVDKTYVRKGEFDIVITNLNDKIDRIDLVSKGNTELLKEILDKVS